MRVFVYGTLTDPDRVREVVGSEEPRSSNSEEPRSSNSEEPRSSNSEEPRFPSGADQRSAESVGRRPAGNEGPRSTTDGDGDAGASFRFAGDATLEGCRRVEGRYPTLAPDPGGRVDGRLLETEAVAALDAYEGVDRGLYVRVAVPSPAGSAAVYVGDPERLGVADRVAWPGDGPLADRVRRYVREEDAAIR